MSTTRDLVPISNYYSRASNEGTAEDTHGDVPGVGAGYLEWFMVNVVECGRRSLYWTPGRTSRLFRRPAAAISGPHLSSFSHVRRPLSASQDIIWTLINPSNAPREHEQTVSGFILISMLNYLRPSLWISDNPRPAGVWLVTRPGGGGQRPPEIFQTSGPISKFQTPFDMWTAQTR